MHYNEMTREELKRKFTESHQPGKLFNLLYGADSKAVFRVFTTINARWSQKDHDVFEKIKDTLETSGMTPGKFFKVHYGKVVEVCAGSKKEAELLYPYFDKLNQFSYSRGWARRTVRTKTYINPVFHVQGVLYTAYHLQMYSCSLGSYLLNDMSEEMLDYKQHNQNYQNQSRGLEDLIAAHLDAGDTEVKDALVRIFNSDNNVASVSVPMIRGIFKSNDRELHKLLGQFLAAARLQEGVRQAVCENMDCGTIEAFRTIFETIEAHDLLRFSAVRRAVATWIGILDVDSLQRSSDKTFALMREVVQDKAAAYKMLDCNDSVRIVVGLWGLGFYEVQDAVKVIEEFAKNGSIQQKEAAAFYNECLDDRKTQQRVANMLMESEGLTLKLAAGIFSTYMPDVHREAMLAAGKKIGERGPVRPVDLKAWFPDEETARKHLHILNGLLWEMKQKEYQFHACVFPWRFVSLTYSQVLLRICAIANSLKMEELMDELAARLPDLDVKENNRVCGVYLLLSNPCTPKRREILIKALGDKESGTRKEALLVAKQMEFTPEEYDRMCELLRLKAADLRLNIISLIREQDADGLKRSLRILLKDKREELRLAGLDILRGLIQDTDEMGNVRSDVETVISEGKNWAQEIEKPSEREQIFLREIFGTAREIVSEENVSVESKELYQESDEIPMPDLTCDIVHYPLFPISPKELAKLYTRLDDLIEQYKDTEIKTSFGETVLLGNQNYLPEWKHVGTWEERIPLWEVWKRFYEEDVKTQERLMAMYLAVKPYALTVGYGDRAASDPVYDRYVKAVMKELFGEAVIDFDAAGYRFGKSERRAGSPAIPGGDLFCSILAHMVNMFCDKEYLNEIGLKVADYLCCRIPKEKRMVRADQRIGWSGKETWLTLLDSTIVRSAIASLCENWSTPEAYRKRFERLYALEQLYVKTPDNLDPWERDGLNHLLLKALDYVVAAYYGCIREEQMYRRIFEPQFLRGNLQNLFLIYRVEKYPAFKFHIKKYGFEDEKLDRYVRDAANTVADAIVKVECKRGDTLTPYSKAVTAIEFYYGMDHLMRLLTALGKDKFERTSSLGLTAMVPVR